MGDSFNHFRYSIGHLYPEGSAADGTQQVRIAGVGVALVKLYSYFSYGGIGRPGDIYAGWENQSVTGKCRDFGSNPYLYNCSQNPQLIGNSVGRNYLTDGIALLILKVREGNDSPSSFFYINRVIIP